MYLPLKAGGYPYGGIGLFSNLFGIEGSVVHITNTGAAFGIFAQAQYGLVLTRLVVTGLLLWYFCKTKLSYRETFAFALILSGAIGNVLDYFLYGHVVDMLYFKLWGINCPIFNAADAFIFCGTAFIILSKLCKRSYAHKPS